MNAYETVGLGGVCELVMGQSPSSDTYNFDGIGLPFFQGNADFGEEHPTPSTWCSEPKKTARKGDILISVRAPIGAVNTATEECCIGRGVAAIRPDESLLNAAFLKYHLIAKRPELERAGTGSTFTAVGKKALSKLEVRLYSLDDQLKMSRRLDVLSENIRTAREQLTMLDYLVKSRFIEMFGDPIDAVSNYRLGDLADMKAGSATTSNDIVSSPGPSLYPCFGGNGLRGYSKSPTHDGIYPLIGRQGALCGNVQIARGTFRATEHAVVVDCGGKCNPEWLYHFLRLDDLGRLSSGAAQPGLSVKNLKRVPIKLPAQNEQEEFVHFATETDKLRFDALRPKDLPLYIIF